MRPTRLLPLLAISGLLACPAALHAKTYGNSSHSQSFSSSSSHSSSPRPSSSSGSSGSSHSYSPATPSPRPHYSSGDPGSAGSRSSGFKPVAHPGDYDAGAAHDAAVAHSQHEYQAAHAPATPSPAATPAYANVLRPSPPITAVNPSYADESAYWHGRFDQQSLQNRSQRYYSTFGPSYISYSGPTYHDWIAPVFFGWLLAQSTDTRGYWAYHHRYEIDPFRYSYLTSDPAVASVVYALEAQQLVRQRHYIPGTFDPDLMYNADYFQTISAPVATAQPVALPIAAALPLASTYSGPSGTTWVWILVGLLAFFIGLLLLGIGTMLIIRHVLGRRGASSPTAGGGTPNEMDLNNPLKLTLGDALQINDIDHSKDPFTVEGMGEWTRDFSRSGGSLRKFTDYELVARRLHVDPLRFRLRLNPTAEKEAHGISQRLLLLERTDEQKWTQELEDILREDKGFREYDDKGTLEAEWWRLNDAHESYLADVTTLTRQAAGARPQVRRSKIEYWDFGRDVPVDGSDEEVREYFFVEMNKDSGWFEFWKGHELDQSEVQ